MAKYQLYIGTYTRPAANGPQSEGIYRATLDAQSGQLGDLELVAKVKDPSFVALGRGGRQLYAVCDFEGSSVAAWNVETNGKLSFLLHESSGGDGACHLGIDASGHNLFVANYGAGSVAAFEILADGSLGARRALVQHSGHGPNPKRQDKPHAHSIYGDETGRFVYACDLGTDEIAIFALDAARGTLSPLETGAGHAPPGAGPRHLALHPRGFAYVNNEMGLSVSAFARNLQTGALTPLQTVPTLPPDAQTAGATTAEIALHPNGKWLYVSNRGHDSIAVFAVGADGKLNLVEHVAAPTEPRGFGISPDGKWLVAAGQKDHQLAAFSIDGASGKLSPRGEKLPVGTPVCVLFAP